MFFIHEPDKILGQQILWFHLGYWAINGKSQKNPKSKYRYLVLRVLRANKIKINNNGWNNYLPAQPFEWNFGFSYEEGHFQQVARHIGKR